MGSQDLGLIGGLDEDLQFGGMDEDFAMGDFGEEGVPIEMEGEFGLAGAISPRSVISEMAPEAMLGLDLEALEVPKRIKGRKKAKAFVPQIDETAEM